VNDDDVKATLSAIAQLGQDWGNCLRSLPSPCLCEAALLVAQAQQGVKPPSLYLSLVHRATAKLSRCPASEVRDRWLEALACHAGEVSVQASAHFALVGTVDPDHGLHEADFPTPEAYQEAVRRGRELWRTWGGYTAYARKKRNDE